MTNYYRLNDDVTIPKRWHLGVARLTDGTEPRLRAGIRLNSSAQLTVPITHGERALEFCLTSFAVPVVSRRVADIVGAVASEDVQILPVKIATHADMYILNALRVVRCLDETRSEFVKWTKQDHRADLAGQYRQITKLVLDRSAIPPSAHVFRIDGSLVELVVSENVKEAIESVGCFGASFIALPA